MTQMGSVVAVLALAGLVVACAATLFRRREKVDLSIRLDRSSIGAHLIWDIVNAGHSPVTLTKLIVRGRDGVADTVPPGLPKVLAPADHFIVPTDVDWSVLAARTVAVADQAGREHAASRRQLSKVQSQLLELIERRVYAASARDWLFGAADLAFGVVILGLGFFMLMWVIATG